MNRSLRILIVSLLAIAALEFAIIGADARTGGGAAGRLPSVEQRLLGEPTPAPNPITLVADADTIDCENGDTTLLTATVQTPSGDLVPDGTVVNFSVVALGTADPVNAQTIDGIATSVITSAAGASDGILVIVASGDNSSSIRLDCASGEQLSPPPGGPPRAIELRATPDEITCDGSETSTIRVRLRDQFDQPIADGTYVEFWTEGEGFGSFSESEVVTSNGEAETEVSFQPYSPDYRPRFFDVRAAAGRLTAALRVYCAPTTPECISPPISPPAHPVSPPCEEEPPQSPPECVEGPQSPETVSPPCPTPTPEPESPPDCEWPFSPPNCNDSTPGATPTPLPEVQMYVDCDVATSGIQDNCDLPPDATSATIGIVIENASDDVAANYDVFGFDLISEGAPLLVPIPSSGGINGNPDFNDGVLSGSDWECSAFADTLPTDVNRDVSRMACFHRGRGIEVDPGVRLEVARVTYDVASTPEDVDIPLTLAHASVGTWQGVELFTCLPFTGCDTVVVGLSAGPQRTATPTPTATPPAPGPEGLIESFDLSEVPPAPFYAALDCDLSKPGVQDRCTFDVDAEAIEVGYVIVNNGTSSLPNCDSTPEDCSLALASFDFVLNDPDRSRLDPPPGADTNRNANPDFNDAAHNETWTCVPPAPDNNRLADDSSAAESFISCFSFGGAGSPLPQNGQHLAAVIRYRIPTDAQTGSVDLTQGLASAGNPNGYPLVNCYSVPAINSACIGATITLTQRGSPASTGTPTAVPTFTSVAFVTITPSPTRTATPVATNTSVPTATATPAPQSNRCADVNDDGRVTKRDLVEIARHIGRRYESRYDVNRDGNVSSRDIIAAFRQLGRRC